MRLSMSWADSTDMARLSSSLSRVVSCPVECVVSDVSVGGVSFPNRRRMVKPSCFEAFQSSSLTFA